LAAFLVIFLIKNFYVRKFGKTEKEIFRRFCAIIQYLKGFCLSNRTHKNTVFSIRVIKFLGYLPAKVVKKIREDFDFYLNFVNGFTVFKGL